MRSILQDWVDLAVEEAMKSPCQSKRGVVIADVAGFPITAKFNHQPYPFRCDGSEACKQNCGKTAIHAEQAALLAVGHRARGGWMLHVKAIDGKPVASGNPSCLECSKLILVAGVAWMHLLHDPVAQMLPGATVEATVPGILSDGTAGDLQVRRYSALHFHWLTAEYAKRIPLIFPPERQCAERSEHG